MKREIKYGKGYINKERIFGFLVFLTNTNIRLTKKNKAALIKIRDHINRLLEE